jgi:rhodanese-related sulfurtransferase
MTTFKYAGEVTSATAFETLLDDPEAVLVDVRTSAEWNFVGVPDLRPIGKTPVFVSWQDYPDMAINQDFPAALRAAGVRPDQRVLLLCRSGQRSRAAAVALTADGFSQAYNVSDGFEGPLDDTGHRGVASGWKAAGLPWIQH